MGAVKIISFQEKDKSPVVEWMKEIPPLALQKAEVRLERLAGLGHELRRPEADYLRDGIYELRWRVRSVNYRILYFFYGREVVVLSHGLTKEDVIPFRDVELAIARKNMFISNPQFYTFKGEIYGENK